jgi:hypothetical protein
VKICRVTGAVALAGLLCVSPMARAQQGLLPPIKRIKTEHGAPGRVVSAPLVVPQELAPPQEAYAAFPETPAAVAAPATPSPCQLRLDKVATFAALPVLIGPGECGAKDAVLLQTVILPDQTKVTIAPPATLRCPMAEQVAEWVRDDVAPAALKLGAPLRGLDNFDSYDCRGRNRVSGATLSEHGRADALDVRLFKLTDGQDIVLTDVKVAKDWREQIRKSACARFSTVLGPGSDGNHEEHIHLDLAERHNGYKICEWDVREPALQAAVAPPPAEETAAQSEPTVGEDDDTAAPLPSDTVPLPRPRPRHLVNAVEDKSAPPKKLDRY